MKQLKLLVIGASLLLSQWVLAMDSPVPMLERIADQMLSTLKQNGALLKKNPKIITEAVQKYLMPHVDTVGMSRSVLGRQAWSKASSAEKAQFTQSFTRLVIRTYATPMSEYTSETIKFLPQHGTNDSAFTRVNSLIIRQNGQTIPLSYSLVQKNGEWKIYDLSVEGVSLLQSFHNQFSQILQNSSIQELIAQMDKKKIKDA